VSKKLFVGSLPWNLSDESLQTAFSQFGNVVSAKVVKDRSTGRSRGFGFVEMEVESEADAAIQGLNETELDGRKIFVSEARSK
jgi:RNA recognition motif-containing protein